jgi:hypothetical protein
MTIDIFRRILHQNSWKLAASSTPASTNFGAKSIRNLIDFHRVLIQNSRLLGFWKKAAMVIDGDIFSHEN